MLEHIMVVQVCVCRCGKLGRVSRIVRSIVICWARSNVWSSTTWPNPLAHYKYFDINLCIQYFGWMAGLRWGFCRQRVWKCDGVFFLTTLLLDVNFWQSYIFGGKYLYILQNYWFNLDLTKSFKLWHKKNDCIIFIIPQVRKTCRVIY